VRGMPFYFLTTLQTTIWNNRYLPVIPTTAAPTIQPSGSDLSGVQSAPETRLPAEQPATQPDSGDGLWSRYKAVLFFVGNNFSHNLIASALTLPTSFIEDDLDHVVNGQGSASLWSYGWDGRLSMEAAILLLLELCLIALGIGTCWSRWKIAGLAPLLLSLAYMLALGLARTSGGRYIVPVDWVTYFYFGVGLVQVGLWTVSLWQPDWAGRQGIAAVQLAGEMGQGEGRWRNGLAVVLVIFLVGLSLPLSSTFFSDPYQAISKNEVLQMLAESGLQDEPGYTGQDL